MAEFAVGAAVLSSLLLGTVTISLYQEAQRRTIVAARHAAFEGGWIGSRVRSQPLSDRLAALHFEDASLVNATGHGRVVDTDTVRATINVVQVPGQGAIATNLLLTPLRVAGGFLGGDFDLDERGFSTGTVEAQIVGSNHLPRPFRDLQLHLDQHFALLTDAWNAGNPAHVAKRAGGLVPGRVLGSLSGLWRGLLAPVSVLEPSLGQLCLGLIEADRVPEDRLEQGASRGAAC